MTLQPGSPGLTRSGTAPRTLQRVAAFLIRAATENWGTKIMAFLLALLVFVVTRDEVQRSFTVPLRVIEDPDRVLRTGLPHSVDVTLRGPWTAVNRIRADELGAAVLDLREVKPGPMQLDPATIVMPPGVVLHELSYDPVDLRFEAIVERAIVIDAVFTGEVAEDYTLTSFRLEPDRWTLRGPESLFAKLDELDTEPIDLSGISRDIDMRVEVLLPDSLGERARELEFVGLEDRKVPTVRLIAEIEPEIGEVAIKVLVGKAVLAALPSVAELDVPQSENVTIRGPLPILREIEDFQLPLKPEVEVEPSREGEPLRVALRFEWSDDVPEATREQLSISPPLVRLSFSGGGGEAPKK